MKTPFYLRSILKYIVGAFKCWQFELIFQNFIPHFSSTRIEALFSYNALPTIAFNFNTSKPNFMVALAASVA